MSTAPDVQMTSEAIIAGALASAPRNALLRHPIFRRIYLVFFVLVTLFILLPAWTILYLPRRNRPRTSWTLERCLRVRFSRRLCGLVARCEIDYLGRDLNLDMDSSKLTHSHGVTIPPAPASWLRGHAKDTLETLLANRSAWNPHLLHRLDRQKAGVWGRWHATEEEYGFAPVKAFWFDGKKVNPEATRRPRQPGQAVMLHFHGGGYLCGTAAETDLTSGIPKHLVVHSPIHHVLSVDYRLAPLAPWPLPLLDAISAYHHLIHDEKVDEKDVILVGDSAGGHLALALTRWIRDEGKALGLNGPRGLVVMSPWADVGFTNAWGDGIHYNADCDTIDDSFGPFATSLLLRAQPASLMHTSSYLSPASLLIPAQATGPDSLAGFPPTFVIYGGAERLAVSIKILYARLQLARRLEKNTSAPDCLIEGPDSPHDFMIFPWMAEESADIYSKLDEWLRNLLASDYDVEVVPQSPEEAKSPDWSRIALARRQSRKLERDGMKTARSPVLEPKKHGMIDMVGDMRSESISLIDLPPLDLTESRGWMTPFTAQYEAGEWDWQQDGPSWFEVESSPDPDDDSDDRKNR